MIRPLSRVSILSSFLTIVAAAPEGAHAQRVAQLARYETRTAWLAPETQGPAKAPKSGGTAALLSFLITGGGQVYNEEYAKGSIMLILGVGFTVMAIDGINEYGCDQYESCAPWLLPVGLAGALTVKVWSIVDAGAGAKRWNRRNNVGMLEVRPALALQQLSGGRVGVTVLQSTF
jgi:TM2 domain-containing membrane protein YozV